jgi:enoyl-CoA hydratase/carnithine racemase
MMPPTEAIRLHRAGPIAVVTIDRAHVMNALDSGARAALAAVLEELKVASDVGAVILTGEGPRAFTVGQDLREAGALGAGTGPEWMAGWVRLYRAIADLEVPSVAAMNGIAAGAGFQLALLCDVRIAASDARFGLREVDVGLPSVSGWWLLASMVGRSRAVELILSGRLVGATEALAIGLLHEVVEPDELWPRVIERAAEFAALPRHALRASKLQLTDLFDAGLADASAAASRYQTDAIETGVPQALMAAFLEGRARRRSSATGAGR